MGTRYSASSPVRDAWRPTPREEFEKRLDRPTSAVVHVGVFAMGSADNRHVEGRKDFQLNYIAEDDCYVIYGNGTLTSKPTTSDRIAGTLRGMITRTFTDVRSGTHRPY